MMGPCDNEHPPTNIHISIYIKLTLKKHVI
jgi:hypothetical protein